MASNRKELFDCIITYGELDPDWYGKYKSYEKEVVKLQWEERMGNS